MSSFCTEGLWPGLLFSVGNNNRAPKEHIYLEGYGGLNLKGLLLLVLKKQRKEKASAAAAAVQEREAKAQETDNAQRDSRMHLEQYRRNWSPERYKEALRAAHAHLTTAS